MEEMLIRFINAITNNIDIADSLNDKINLINQNVQYNINLTWTILGVAIAIAGLALFTLSKSWVDKRVDEELPKIVRNNPPIISFYKELNPDSGLAGHYSKYTIDVNLSKYKINNLGDLLCFSIFEKKYFCFNKPGFEEERFNKELESINKNGCIKILDDYSLNIDFERQQIEIFIITDTITVGDNSKKYCEFFIINPKYK